MTFTITIPPLHAGYWLFPFIMTVAWLAYVIYSSMKFSRPTSIWRNLGIEESIARIFQIVLFIPILLSWIIWLAFK